MQNAQLWAEDLTHEGLFAEHYSWLMHWALTFTEGQHSEAEDLVHDLFIQLVRLRPQLHADVDQVRGYLYTMLRNMHLSKVRRAQRSQIIELSAVDYDSLEQGLRSVPQRSPFAVWMELWHVCEYACERKKTSRSASVLILRFFLGYFPSEIARILKTTRTPVDKYLHAARREARLAVARPAALRVFGPKRMACDVPPPPDDSQDFFLALRAQVFRCREGECFARASLERIYAPVSTESLSTFDLAHLVSCRECLDTLNLILGIRLLADRCPSKTLRRDGGPPKDGGSGSGGGSVDRALREATQRLEEENEHRPNYLQVAVSGDMKTSQKITAEFSEFLFKVSRNRVLEFIEIFSEQHIRLLYLPIDSSSHPMLSEQQARIELSDGRTLDVSVFFGTDSPSICVPYHDPLFAGAEAMDESALFALFGADNGTKRNLIEPRGMKKLLARARSLGRSIWPVGALATATASVLVALGLMVQHHAQFSGSPADLLRRADQAAASQIAPHELVRRTIQMRELGDSGQFISENSIEEWISGDAQRRARRLYDHQGALISEEITSASQTTLYGKSGLGKISKLNPAHLRVQDVWQITPSADQFQQLIAPSAPSTMQQEGDHYSIHYHSSVSGAQPGLVEATLVLRKKDLHPVEEDLVLRGGGELQHFQLIEASYDFYSPAQIHRDIFAPDEQLSKGTPVASARDEFSGASVASEETPERIIHALYLLSRIGADMNGETSVEAASDGSLSITGTVATHERRDEILRILDPMRAERGIVIQLQTPDQIHSSGKEDQGGQTVEVIQPAEGAIPLDHQVRQILSRQGIADQEMDQAVERFSQQVLAHADEAQQHAWALDLIARRFTPEQLAGISTEARWEWIQIVDLHSSALLRSVRTIRSEFLTLGPSSLEADAVVEPITNAKDLARAADQLLQLSIFCDRSLASALTLSATPENGKGLNEAGFWRSLNRLEAFAREAAATNRMLQTAVARPSPLLPLGSQSGSSQAANH